MIPMKKMLIVINLCLLIPLLGLAQDDVEWFRWGPASGFHVKAQRLVEDTTVLHGIYKAYYQENVMADGTFEMGKKSGTWKYFNEGESLACEGNYLEGNKQGKWTYYFINGNTQCIKSFDDGMESGTWKSYYSNQTSYAELKHSNGWPQELKVFFNNADSALVRDFRFDGARVHVNHRSWYKNGPTRELMKYSFLLEDTLMADLEQHRLPNYFIGFFDHRAGKELEPKTSIRIEGQHKMYHPTGPMQAHHIYDDGILSNVIPAFDKWGNIQDFGTWKDGNGLLISYHHNGDTARIVGYSEGKMNGHFYTYEERGRLRQKGKMCNGSPCGSWINFDVNLKMDHQLLFNDRTDGYQLISYAGNNRKSAMSNWSDGRMNGAMLEFDQYLDTLSHFHFINGLQHGTQKRFINGSLKEKGQAQFGQPIGIWKTYNPKGKITYEELMSDNGYINESFHSYRQEWFLWPTDQEPLSYDFLPPRITSNYFENEVLNIGNQLWQLNISTGGSEGDVIFLVTVEDTGHVKSIECMKHNGKEFYTAALKRLEGMLFAQPGEIFGIPQTSSFYLAFHFEPI